MPGQVLTFAAEAPHYFPACEYFQKIAAADAFVIADDLQFSKHDSINRCRIKTASGALWLTVPVRSKSRFGQRINAVEILNDGAWQRKHWQTLVANYCRSAYFEKYAEALARILHTRWENLADLNCATMEWSCRVLQIDCRLVRSSQWPKETRGNARLAAWAVELGAGFYLCDGAEKNRLELEGFKHPGLAVWEMVSARHPFYHQLFGEFLPNLSILDLILNEGDRSGTILKKPTPGHP